MTTDKRWQATAASITPAENGYVIALQAFDATLMLVAKDMDEVATLLKDIDIRVMARGLGEHIGRIGGAERLAREMELVRANQRAALGDPYPGGGSADMAMGMSAAEINRA